MKPPLPAKAANPFVPLLVLVDVLVFPFTYICAWTFHPNLSYNLTDWRWLLIASLPVCHLVWILGLRDTRPNAFWSVRPGHPFATRKLSGHEPIRTGLTPPDPAEDLLDRSPIRLDDAVVGCFIREGVMLVTGAAGSIGSELVRQLLRHSPRQIILLDQSESGLFELDFTLRHAISKALVPVRTILTPQVADVSDERRMQQVFAMHRPDFVFHAAAYKHVPLMEEHPYEAVKVNVLGTKIMADLAVRFGVTRFVLISTDKAVRPTNVMGATKRFAELYVQNLNGPTTTATAPVRFMATRFGNVLGSSGSVVPIFKRQIEAGGPVTVTHPEITRYFMTVSEACQLVLEAAAIGNGGEVFSFDMGQPVRIADLARQMIQRAGYIVNKDIALLFTGLRPGEKLYEELLGADDLTLPTHHPKINVARLRSPDAVRLEAALHHLTLALGSGDDLSLIRILKELMPEYVSNNSPYTRLDQPGLTATPT